MGFKSKTSFGLTDGIIFLMPFQIETHLFKNMFKVCDGE